MPISNRPPAWLPMTIGSGWVERTWRSGPVRYDEAQRWLDACLKRRPEDVPVWRARLSWGIATDQLDVVRQAVDAPASRGVDPGPGPSAEGLARRQTGGSRRSSAGNWSTSWRKIPPIGRPSTGSPNWRRRRGSRLKPPKLIGKKAEIDRLRARYEKLYDRNQPIRDAEEMARLAEQLGRQFEARVFLTWRSRKSPTART